MVGRKTKLTPELAEKISNYISTGNYAVVVCGLVGIGESTYYSWLEKGVQAKSGKYREFLESIKRAEAAREARWIKNIDDDPSWQSKAWLLERRYPERWSKKETVKVEGGEKPLKVQNDTITEQILSDPIALELVFQLRERIRMGQNEPVGTGGAGESGEMDPGTTS